MLSAIDHETTKKKVFTLNSKIVLNITPIMHLFSQLLGSPLYILEVNKFDCNFLVTQLN